jgi:hypothetical protein
MKRRLRRDSRADFFVAGGKPMSHTRRSGVAMRGVLARCATPYVDISISLFRAPRRNVVLRSIDNAQSARENADLRSKCRSRAIPAALDCGEKVASFERHRRQRKSRRKAPDACGRIPAPARRADYGNEARSKPSASLHSSGEVLAIALRQHHAVAATLRAPELSARSLVSGARNFASLKQMFDRGAIVRYSDF